MELQTMIAGWVRDARTAAGLSGAALGARLALELGTERGHTKANISHWENEKHSPNLKQLLAIARVTGKSLPADILAPMSGKPWGESAVDVSEAMRVVSAENDDDGFVQIPMVKLRLSAGITGYQTEPERRDGGTLGMRRTWLERNQYNPTHLIAIYVKGESMEPSLYAGDIVVINTLDTKLVDGAVYAFNYEGEAVVKRLARDAGQWWLTSDNVDKGKYHRKLCQGGDCIVIGRVVRKESDRI
ncbi:S24 family peptidase [Massilia sp. YIM B02443]|uniref:S24 family peptidase n=1 Tax=Massilia sp. YIM B02443 TaxID=3050127 RepID=UPI0025B66AAE|nr:S24 family peptidase [Massilia sp. YIM B02443]MDN4039541.1 S24 family peptidase [Massilia sp. YIM B02443]